MTIIEFLDDSELGSGFRIDNPRRLRVLFYIEGNAPRRTEKVELITNINLSDYTTGSGVTEEYHAVGWKHIAWTYDKTTGIARLFENGKQAIITHVNGLACPPLDFFDGPDNRPLILPSHPGSNTTKSLRFIITNSVNTRSLIDEIRISASALLPRQFLTVSPNYCIGKLQSDHNGDCQINLLDWAILAAQWLKNSNPY
ncbi:MAG: hypothetical protein GY869_23310, partial [Planctomycetes bacterium]|nr:hypothetical protein [Planctomycetota bacterium]